MAGRVAGNNNLRALRLQQHPKWTQTRLAHQLTVAARELDIQVAERASLVVRISLWENGRSMPDPDYRRLLRHVYGVSDVELGLTAPVAGVGLDEQLGQIPFHSTWDESFTQASREWDMDIERRGFIKTAAYVGAASTVPALQWFLGEAEAIARADGDIRVGAAHVESIQEMTKVFRRMDNRFGGDHGRASVIRFLATEVKPLIIRGRYDTETGSRLLSAAAEALQLAGWMTDDAGEHGLGQRYMTQALRLALAAGDGPLGAEILAGLSHQASFLGDAATAVDLARAAGKAARQHGLGALVAEALVMEAHGHAVAGDATACAAQLSAAELALDRADRSSDPGWMSYFDEAYLSAKFGHCFRELRDAATAERFARRSLDMDGSYVRGKSFNLALLATAHAQAGDIEAACSVGQEAAALVTDLQSARARTYLRRLQDELKPAASAPCVIDLRERLEPLLAEAV